MSSIFSTPSRKERIEEQVSSRTPLRSSPGDSLNQPPSTTNSNASKKSNSSDLPKSFLALGAESSPSTNAIDSGPSFSLSSVSSNSPAKMTNTAESIKNPLITTTNNRNRFDAESSFFPMTSPMGSQVVSDGSERNASTDFEGRFEATKSNIASRGSRLGALMGRTRSAQPEGYSGSGQSPLSPTNQKGSSVASISPTRKGAGDANLLGSGSLTSRMMIQSRSYSPSGPLLEEQGEESSKERAMPYKATIANSERSVTESIRAQANASAQKGMTQKSKFEGISRTQSSESSSPTRQFSSIRRNETTAPIIEDDSALDPSASLAQISLKGASQDGHGSLSRTSSHGGDVYSAASSSVTSPDRATQGSQQMGMPRTGRLSRLQYSKGDFVVPQMGPGWNTSSSSIRSASTQNNQQGLVVRVSNPNLLADYKKGESSSEIHWADNSRKSSISSIAQDASSTVNSSVQDHGVSDASSRAAERRELMLPGLSEMRSAVQSVVSTSTETFLRKGERRGSAIAFHQFTTARDEKGDAGVNGVDRTSLQRAAQVQEHNKTTSIGTNASSATTEDGWQRVNEDQRLKSSTGKQDFTFSSSSPMHSSILTTREDPLAGGLGFNTRVGQLSDDEIVRLGAVPGVRPSSLLNENGQPLSSKNILTIALQKAQSSVLLDSSNNVPEAIMAYRQAVRLLEEVMERVSPQNTSSDRRKISREDERRRLKVIHDTYADRIRLLSMVYSPEEELGDSSVGEDSFARQSPTPLPANKSRTAALLDGLGINGNEADLRATPQISISDQGLSAEGRGKGKHSQSRTREEMQVTTGDETKHSSLQRSDSGSSFQSARDPVSTIGHEGRAGLQPPSNRTHLLPKKATGEEEFITPETPYFDADPSLTNHDLSPRDGLLSAITERQTVQRPISTLAPLRSVPLDERRSRSPQDRTNRGISSLSNVPSATTIEAGDMAASPASSRRFLSLGSQSQFQRDVSPQPPSALQSEVEVPSKEKLALEKQPTASPTNRPRALTVSANEQGRNLVSNSVSSGTISQRRKLASGVTSTSSGGVQGSDDEVVRSEGGNYSEVPSDVASTHDESLLYGTPSDKSPTNEEEWDARAGLKGSSGRKRAISQPSNRRPSIPASFMLNSQPPPGSPHGPPPVPKIKRKVSMPLSPLVTQPLLTSQQNTLRASTLTGLGNAASGFRFPSPAPSATSGYHALGTPGTPYTSYPLSGQLIGGYNSEGKGAIMSDLFPSSLPSVHMSSPPSFTSNSYSTHLPWLGITNALPDPILVALPPAQKTLRPFYTMKLLQASIERGGYITRRLYLPRELWMQSGSRLLAVETKVRMVLSISSGLEGIEQTGRFLLHPTHTDQPGLNAINASKFLKMLEEFETLLIEVQNTLAKKLGFLETVHGKKANTSFGALSSKLTRSLDRMTNNAKHHLDAPATYVDGLLRLFIKAQVVGDHLNTLYRSKRTVDNFSSPTTRETEWEDHISVDTYATLPAELKGSIEIRLKRSSEFFSNVILRFVLRDVAILMDKSVKRNTVLLTE